MNELTVKYKNSENGDSTTDNEIARIFVVSETEHAVIIHLETATKYPKPLLYGGGSVSFLTTAGNVAIVAACDLPFDDVQVIAEASRYGMFVIFFHDVREDARQVYMERPDEI